MFGIEGAAAWQRQKQRVPKSKGNDFRGLQASACVQTALSGDNLLITVQLNI
jgi:hypothetical protein